MMGMVGWWPLFHMEGGGFGVEEGERGIQELLKESSKFSNDSNSWEGVSIQAEFAPSRSRSALLFLEQIKCY